MPTRMLWSMRPGMVMPMQMPRMAWGCQRNEVAIVEKNRHEASPKNSVDQGQDRGWAGAPPQTSRPKGRRRCGIPGNSRNERERKNHCRTICCIAAHNDVEPVMTHEYEGRSAAGAGCGACPQANTAIHRDRPLRSPRPTATYKVGRAQAHRPEALERQIRDVQESSPLRRPTEMPARAAESRSQRG